MRNFLKMLIASILGVFIAMFLVWILTIGILVGMLSSLGSSKTIYQLSDNTVLRLDLEGSITERETSELVSGLFGSSEKSIGLDDILKAIQTAKENDKIIGIYVKIGILSAGTATLEPIRNAFIDFKESGKFVVAYGDYYTQNAYYLASVADKVIMNPQGMLMFRGMFANLQFSKGLFDKLGINFEVFRVGTFKSAIEPLTETQMSEANREQTMSYVNCIWSHLLAGISESRGISVENLNMYADEYMTFSDPEKSVEYKLMDALMYAPDVTDYIKELAGAYEIKYATVANINSVPARNFRIAKDRIAVLYAEGPIMHGKNRGLGPLMGDNVITDDEYVRELIRLKDDQNVKAVVFRINSGGGSAYASEQIWRAVMELKEEKPVIVSMGDVAASGGYYIACGADMIFAEPTTITGSIGVFGVFPEGVELHRKIGLTFDGIKTNKHSDLEAMSAIAKVKPFSDDERMILQGYVNRVYDVFLTRCADGRSKTIEEIDAVGQGRVWTGRQAFQIGLIDRLGGLEDAIKIAAERAELTDYDVDSYPRIKDTFTRLMEELTGGGVKASLIRSFLGDDVYRQYLIANKKVTPLDFVQAVIEF